MFGVDGSGINLQSYIVEIINLTKSSNVKKFNFLKMSNLEEEKSYGIIKRKSRAKVEHCI